MATLAGSNVDWNGDLVDEVEQDYPRSWIWDEDGDHVAGTFVRFDRAHTRDYGSRAILVLSIDDVERSVWLSQNVLLNRVRDEVAERPTRNLTVGERVSIRRLGKAESESGRSYWKFRLAFPDRPELSASDVLGLDDPPVDTAASELGQPASAQDDGIPF